MAWTWRTRLVAQRQRIGGHCGLTAARRWPWPFVAAWRGGFSSQSPSWAAIAGCGVLLCALLLFASTVFAGLAECSSIGAGIADSAMGIADLGHHTISGPCQTHPAIGYPRSRAASRLRAGGRLLLTRSCGLRWRVHYDHNLLNLQAADLDSVKWELTLIEHTAGRSWHALSCRGHARQATGSAGPYEKLPEVSRVVEGAAAGPHPTRMPSRTCWPTCQRQLVIAETRGRHSPRRPDSNEVMAQAKMRCSRVSRCLWRERPFFADCGTALANCETGCNRSRVRSRPESGCRPLDNRLAGDLAENPASRLQRGIRPGTIRLQDMPADLAPDANYVGTSGRMAAAGVRQDSLWDFERLNR